MGHKASHGAHLQTTFIRNRCRKPMICSHGATASWERRIRGPFVNDRVGLRNHPGTQTNRPTLTLTGCEEPTGMQARQQRRRRHARGLCPDRSGCSRGRLLHPGQVRDGSGPNDLASRNDPDTFNGPDEDAADHPTLRATLGRGFGTRAVLPPSATQQAIARMTGKR